MALELNVLLQGIDPPIWRRIVVSPTTTLAEFHLVLQRAMGWRDRHLHQFIVAGRAYGPPDPAGMLDLVDSRSTRLEDVASIGDTFLYEYDFGDGWLHEIEVEKATSTSSLPRCVDGARACPPEDCGGVPGYQRLLAVLGDPTDEEHSNLLAWAGGRFDPEAFDRDAVNRALRVSGAHDPLA